MIEMQDQITKFLRTAPVNGYGFVSLLKKHNIPDDFHPGNLVLNAKSVIVFLVAFPKKRYYSNEMPQYDDDYKEINTRVNMITDKLTAILTDLGAEAFPVYPDEELFPGQGAISLKYFAYLAGLGRISKNNNLISPKFGNMVGIGAVVTDIPMPQSKMLITETCDGDSCLQCLKKCRRDLNDGEMCTECKEPIILNSGYKPYSECAVCRMKCAANHKLTDKKI